MSSQIFSGKELQKLSAILIFLEKSELSLGMKKHKKKGDLFQFGDKIICRINRSVLTHLLVNF